MKAGIAKSAALRALDSTMDRTIKMLLTNDPKGQNRWMIPIIYVPPGRRGKTGECRSRLLRVGTGRRPLAAERLVRRSGRESFRNAPDLGYYLY
jgi:hypothetical protein